jgi:hypothetical protein
MNNIKELTVTATIPTAQYANLQPSITVEVDGDFDEAKQTAMAEIVKFSQQYAEKDKSIGTASPTRVLEKLIPFIGETEMYFDKELHAYYDVNGTLFDSPSKIAEAYTYPFMTDAIAPAYAKKYEVELQDVKDFWKSKADCSTTFGTALHQALETYGKWLELVETLNSPDKPVLIGIHPTFLPIVEAFFKGREDEQAVYEPFVVDAKNKRCGKPDRLIIVDPIKKICDIDDYKTNADLDKQGTPKFLKSPYNTLPNTPAGKYNIQLNVYRDIIENNGWTVRNINMRHWGGIKWETIPVPRLEIQ